MNLTLHAKQFAVAIAGAKVANLRKDPGFNHPVAGRT